MSMKWVNSSPLLTEETFTLQSSSIRQLAERTGMPFEAISRASNGYPTLISVKRRRFSICVFERGLLNKDIEHAHLGDLGEFEGKLGKYGRPSRINGSEDNYRAVIEYISTAYEAPLRLKENWKEMVSKAAEVFPSGNVVMRDRWGIYCGHIVTLPLSFDGNVERFKDIEDERSFLSGADILERKDLWKSKVHLHIYSTFAAHSVYAWILIKKYLEYLKSNVGDKKLTVEGILTAFPTNPDSGEIISAIGLLPYSDVAIHDEPFAADDFSPQVYLIELQTLVEEMKEKKLVR